MSIKELVKKWDDILKEGREIRNPRVRKSTARMLENEVTYLKETGNWSEVGRGSPYAISGDFHQIAVPMVRRTFPELIAHDVVGVQPMVGPVGLAFALRFRASGTYDSTTDKELGYNYMDTSYSGSTGLAYETGMTYDSTGSAMNTSAGELRGSGTITGSYEAGLGVGSGTAIKEVNMTVEKAQVTAGTRKLRSRWSLEVAQDLKAMHGLDLEEEMLDILAYEITAEIDREIVNTINAVAVSSAWDYDSPMDADGRWQSEKFRTLYNMIVRKANRIAILTRRGAGNFVIASPYACAALETLSSFVIHPTDGDMNTLVAGVSRMGSLDGRLTVFRDTFAATDYVTVGYKGPSEYDAGIIYLPYVQLMVSKTVYEQSFHPTVGLLSRYAIHQHIFGANLYYQKIGLYNLPA